MSIEEYLEFIKAIDSEIARKKYEYNMWKDATIGGSISNGERVQSSGNKQQMAYAVAKYVDIEREILELMEKKSEFSRVISMLPEREKEVMHLVYIQGYELKDVKRLKQKSYNWASMVHRKAIRLLKEVKEEW